MNHQRKNQIIETAASLFREKGYNAVSMRDLAEELGIKASSLYNHIASKEEILAEIIMDLAKAFTEHILRVVQEDSTAVEKINQIIEMHVHTTIHRTDNLACMNKEWKNLAEEKQQIYKSLRKQYEHQFQMIIKEGIAHCEIENRNPEIMAFSILSTLRTLYHWYANRQHLTESVLITNLQNNMLKGVVIAKS